MRLVRNYIRKIVREVLADHDLLPEQRKALNEQRAVGAKVVTLDVDGIRADALDRVLAAKASARAAEDQVRILWGAAPPARPSLKPRNKDRG